MTTPAILAALRTVLPYATTEADNLRAMAAEDASVADEADAATHAVTAARLALAGEWRPVAIVDNEPDMYADVLFSDGQMRQRLPVWAHCQVPADRNASDVVAYRIVP